MENTNNIKVTVLNNSNEIIDKLKALDSKGGAIEIEYNEKGKAKQEFILKAEHDTKRIRRKIKCYR